MPATKKKTYTLSVTVTGPEWMTKAQAKDEVRALIGHQSFYGHRSEEGEEVNEENFKLGRVE